MWFNVLSAITFVVACLLAYRFGFVRGLRDGVRRSLHMLALMMGPGRGGHMTQGVPPVSQEDKKNEG